jgi:hypothetical protein
MSVFGKFHQACLADKDFATRLLVYLDTHYDLLNVELIFDEAPRILAEENLATSPLTKKVLEDAVHELMVFSVENPRGMIFMKATMNVACQLVWKDNIRTFAQLFSGTAEITKKIAGVLFAIIYSITGSQIANGEYLPEWSAERFEWLDVDRATYEEMSTYINWRLGR